MDLRNSTPFVAAPFFMMDRRGAETLVVIIKETWRITSSGTLTIADKQVPIQLAPQYSGEPGSSSLLDDTDLVLEKPGTDCVLLGHACAPRENATHVDVTFAVGAVRKQARVFGERVWSKTLGICSISRPAPFRKIPLTWERAFGGKDTTWQNPDGHEFFSENPVGTGYLARRSTKEIDGLSLPNIENPAELIKKPHDRPAPVGFSMIPPYWPPRSRYAGTYDDTWRESMSPLPPADLDPRFYSAAAPGLISQPHLTGGERVLVEGVTPQGHLQFCLPGHTPKVKVRRSQGEEELRPRFDTIVVEPDDERVVLVWRAAVNVHCRIHETGPVRVE